MTSSQIVKVEEDHETTASDIGCYYRENLGKDCGGSSNAEREYTVLKVEPTMNMRKHL